MLKRKVLLFCVLIVAIIILLAPDHDIMAQKKSYKVFPNGVIVPVIESDNNFKESKPSNDKSLSRESSDISYDTIYVKASITKYVATGNNMASCKKPYIGAVACSDYSISKPPWNARVKINGKWYDVKDRTAKWIHKKHGLTFDIYSNETKRQCLKFGRKNMDVIVVIPKK